jgi:hypothetical protein
MTGKVAALLSMIIDENTVIMMLKLGPIVD